MTAKQYEKLSAPFRRPGCEKYLNILNSTLTTLGYITYPLLLIYLFLKHDPHLWPAILIPGSGFLLLSFIRAKINRKRPYEALEIRPIIHRGSSGKSMPSRHTFSMFAVAMTWFWIFPLPGIILLFCGVIIAVTRVIGGVHYPSDVIVGALSGILWEALGFSLTSAFFL